MKVSIVTAPTDEPITINEAKDFLRVDTEDDDPLIISLIKVSREYAESVTHRALMTQTWKYYLEDWPTDDYIELPFPPLQSVTHIKYTNSAGTQTTVSTSEYNHDTVSEKGRVQLAYGYNWPTATLTPTNPIEIQFVAGYGTPDDIPESIKQGMKVDITDMYENREMLVIGHIVERDPVLDRLYMPYRTFDY